MKQTGKQIDIPKTDMKPLMTYLALITGAMVTEGQTPVRGMEYIGWTSIGQLGRILGGDLPSLQVIGGIGKLVTGAFSANEDLLREGWGDVRPDRFIKIIAQLEDIAEGKTDILSLFMYMERDEMRKESKSNRRAFEKPTR